MTTLVSDMPSMAVRLVSEVGYVMISSADFAVAGHLSGRYLPGCPSSANE
jgi:hypothetical protein